MKALIALAALLALSAFGAGARAEYSPPPKGTWGVGIMGPGTFYDDGQPSIKYFATDKLALEFIPVFFFQRTRTGNFDNTNKNIILNFDTLYRLGSYKGVNLSLLAGVGLKNFYDRNNSSFPSNPSKETVRALFINTGFEVEYFVRPQLSVAFRNLFSAIYERDALYSTGSTTGESSFKILFWGAHGVNVHYYFLPPSADDGKDSAPSGTGKWALGWQGFGDRYGNAQPSIKYAFSDQNAIELIPQWTWSHTDSAAAYTHNQSFSLPIDWEHRLMARGPVTFSSVVEPMAGNQYLEQGGGGTRHTNIWTWGLSAGIETEYFVVPTLSLGARALLTYQQSRSQSYTPSSFTVTNTLRPTGQVLNVHWYFGGAK